MALQVLVFAATLWLGFYLLARDPAKSRLRWTGSGLVTYALAIAANLLEIAASGAIFILAPRGLSRMTGISPAMAFTVIGIGLLGYAAWLWLNARDPRVSRRVALAPITGDSLWVIASIIILLGDYLPLSTAGKWGVALIADIVGIFAILQLAGLRPLSSE